MLKKGKKEKNKFKKVHFNEAQIKVKKAKSRSVDKDYINEDMNNLENSNRPSRSSTVSEQKKISIEDFNTIEELGSGPYSKIVLSRHLLNGKNYAIKKINKSTLKDLDRQHEVHIEKHCLSLLKHPNIIKLKKTFQDKKTLYFVLEYCKNKDLGKFINCLGKFDYTMAQFYSAEILRAISYMHKEGIYHRDIRPENIGIDEFMHLKLFDFATSNKVNKYFDLRTMKFIDLNEDELLILNENMKDIKDNMVKVNLYTILLLNRLYVGAPEYVSPEVLEKNYSLIGPGVDIWSFGIMLYLFFTGSTPFKGKEEAETLENIKNVKYSFDDNLVPEDAKDLISKILIKDPTKRLGYQSKDYSEIKSHPFFKDINFDNLETQYPPILLVKEKLEQSGYPMPKTEEEKNDPFNNLYEDREIEGDDDDDIIEDNSLLKRLSGNKFFELKKNLKGESNDHNVKKVEKPEKEIEEDIVILEGILQKKSPWLHYNTRLVKFFSRGHIDYYDPKTKELKGSFIINSNCIVNFIDEYKFEIETMNRSFCFKHKKKIAKEWVNKINEYISKCAKKKLVISK